MEKLGFPWLSHVGSFLVMGAYPVGYVNELRRKGKLDEWWLLFCDAVLVRLELILCGMIDCSVNWI